MRRNRERLAVAGDRTQDTWLAASVLLSYLLQNHFISSVKRYVHLVLHFLAFQSLPSAL